MQLTLTPRVQYFFLLLFIPFVITGCGSKGETTTAWSANTWTPTPPVSVYMKREEKGLWKASFSVNVGEVAAGAGLPLENLGVFSIDHEFDYREDFTYIVIKNDAKGTEQVFKLGVNKGKVKLHITGDHDLTLEPEEDGKIVIDDNAHYGSMTILVYPEGQQIATVSIDNGPSFVFLTGNRIHIKYQSIGNAIQTEKVNLDWDSLLKQDDTLSLNAVQTIIYQRSFRQSSLGIYFNPGVQEQPINVDLPLDDANLDSELDTLQSTVQRLQKRAIFQKEYSTDSITPTVEFAIFIAAIFAFSTIITLFNLLLEGRAASAFGSIAGISFFCLVGTMLYLYTDVDVAGTAFDPIEISLSQHLWLIVAVSLILIFAFVKMTCGRSRRYV